MGEQYLWITRWEDFQHYQPERDRAPGWIKTYTKQLDDDRYLDLTLQQRAVLHDLRSAFARSHGRLTSAPAQLTRRINGRVTSALLAALNHAGFIEFVSREVLEQRLEKFYASRAPARSRRSKKLEGEGERASTPLATPPATSNGKALGFHKQQIEHSLAEAETNRGDN
jgi:hypothetical protein